MEQELPLDFVKRMKGLLGEEYPAFIQAYDQERHLGLRLNPEKINRMEFLQAVHFHLSPIPWEKNGFYYMDTDAPGKHPYHACGAYYIQEPSAMAPVGYLDVRPGQKVLDLCGAPGGKSTQIGVAMKGRGLLVCNEIHPARARILSENVERMGIRNGVVTNEEPAKLSEMFQGFFDRILVDAPCSGEGMFRKNPEAMAEWSLDNVKRCACRQGEILEQAAAMLKPGGRLVYSTCTFSPEENEGTISQFLDHHGEFSIVPVGKYPGMEGGRGDWISHPASGLEHTIRLWPQKLEGEGHYLAVLEKEGDGTGSGYCRNSQITGLPKKEWMDAWNFFQETINTLSVQETIDTPSVQEETETGVGKEKPLDIGYQENLLEALESRPVFRFGEQLYLAPEGMCDLQGLRVLRPGLHLGTLKKNRIEPAHALALALSPREVRYTLDLPASDPRTAGWMRGEGCACQGEKGWYLISVDGCSLGWGKLAGGQMKNHYPKGLRK